MEELTKKQKVFVKEYVKTENGTQSALKAYDTKDYSTAGNIASENLNKPKIVAVLKTLAERIPDDLVIEKHIALLNKTEKKYNSDGDLVSEEIDVQAVKAGVDMSYKLKKAYETDEHQNINVLMPVLVKFLNGKDDRSDNGDTVGVS